MNKFTFFKGMDFVHTIKIEYKPEHLLGFVVKSKDNYNKTEEIVRLIVMSNIMDNGPDEEMIINTLRTYFHPLSIIRERTAGMFWQSGL